MKNRTTPPAGRWANEPGRVERLHAEPRLFVRLGQAEHAFEKLT